MALKITRAADPIHVQQLVVVLYAPPGVGKSTMGFTAEAPLLLDFDGGAYRAANRGDTVQVASWIEVAGITADDLRDYQTVVVDTAGRALDVLSADIIASNPKMGRGGALTLQGFGELKAKFIAWTKLLRSFGKDVVLLAHSDEQRNGDEIIERLDVQGGSKGEIYKAADAMGRIAIRNGARVLNFSPTDTAFGKNPGQLEPMAVPDVSQAPHFLGDVIQSIKDRLNALSDAQRAELRRIEDLLTSFDALKDAEAFNSQVAKMADAQPKDKALLVRAAESRGFVFDKKAKRFSVKEAA